MNVADKCRMLYGANKVDVISENLVRMGRRLISNKFNMELSRDFIIHKLNTHYLILGINNSPLATVRLDANEIDYVRFVRNIDDHICTLMNNDKHLIILYVKYDNQILNYSIRTKHKINTIIRGSIENSKVNIDFASGVEIIKLRYGKLTGDIEERKGNLRLY